MKRKIPFLALLGAVALSLMAATLVVKKTSDYPRVTTPGLNDLFLLAITNAPATNNSIRYSDLKASINTGVSNLGATNITAVTINVTTQVFTVAKGGHVTISNNVTILTNATLSLSNLPAPAVLMVGADRNATNATLSGLTLSGTTITRDALTGDVTTSGNAATVANNAVSYAKMQDVSATARAIGRNTSGAGDPEEVTGTQILDWIGSTRGSVLYRGASGWSVLAPNTAGYVLTDGGTGADPAWAAAAAGGMSASASQYTIVGGSASATLNWLALSNAWITAKTATPNGAALSRANRYTIFLLPGVYDLGAVGLVITNQYIDLIGLSTSTGRQQYTEDATDYGDTLLKSSVDTILLATGAGDNTIANVALLTSGMATVKFAFGSSIDVPVTFRMQNVYIHGTGGGNNTPMGQGNYGGTWIDVRCFQPDSFGNRFSATSSGFFLRCKAGDESFGQTASGVFIDCEAGASSFGYSTCSGTFIRCRWTTLGSSGDFMKGTFTGTAIDCDAGVTSTLNYSSGTVRNCIFNGVIENRGLLLKTTGGFASTDTTAAVSIAATGWTNTTTKSATVDFDGTTMTWTVYNSAGTAIYTNATAHTGAMSRVIQPSGKIIITGTDVVGRAAPL
jgi:hypothetical protein